MPLIFVSDICWTVFIAMTKGGLIVGRFNHEGFHQLQNSFVADEDLRGRSTQLLLTPLLSLLRELLDIPQKHALLL